MTDSPFVTVHRLYVETIAQVDAALVHQPPDTDLLGVAVHRLYGAVAATSQLVELVDRAHGGITNLEATGLNAASSLTLYAAARMAARIEDPDMRLGHKWGWVRSDLKRVQLAASIIDETARAWAARQVVDNS